MTFFLVLTFLFFVDANSELPENKNANIGHANASVYCIGPQYEYDTPVNSINKNSTILSTAKYTVINVSTQVAKVFLLTPNFFKKLSIIFII